MTEAAFDNEHWRFTDLDLIEVSSRGRVRTTQGKLLSTESRHEGYPVVSHRGVQYKVHRLVAAAFIGPIPPGLVVNHLDGCKANNAVENLEICTVQENNRHAQMTGLMASGSRNGMHTKPSGRRFGQRSNFCKLTPEQVVEIKRRADLGELPQDIAPDFGVGRLTVWQIKTGRRWAHLFGGINLPRKTDRRRRTIPLSPLPIMNKEPER